MCHLQEDVRISLPARPEALAEVRRVVRNVTGHEHVDDEQREHAVLMASEAAANVVRHTDSPVIDLSVACDEQRLRVSVADHDPTPISQPSIDLTGVSGRGLAIIDRLATRWGVNLHADGKELWIEAAAHNRDPAP